MTNTPKSADIALTKELNQNLKSSANCAQKVETALMTPEQATKLHNEIVQLTYLATDVAYKLGARLKIMRDRRGYVALDYDSMEHYIQSLKEVARRHCYACLRLNRCLEERLGSLQIDPKLILETHYTKMLMISRFLLEKNDYGEWKYNNDIVVEWIHKANTLDSDDLKKEVKDFFTQKKGIRPDPLVIKSKPCVYFHHGTISKDGSWVVEFRQFRPQWDISLQNLYDSLKGKKLQLIIKEVEE